MFSERMCRARVYHNDSLHHVDRGSRCTNGTHEYLALMSQTFNPEPIVEQCFDALGLPPCHLITRIRKCSIERTLVLFTDAEWNKIITDAGW